MHGPWLNTLQNDGVQGWPSSTLQGACENGVASIWRRDWASAALIPTNRPIRQKTAGRNMWRDPHERPNQAGARVGPHQGGWRSHPRVHGRQFRNQGLLAGLIEDAGRIERDAAIERDVDLHHRAATLGRALDMLAEYPHGLGD